MCVAHHNKISPSLVNNKVSDYFSRRWPQRYFQSEREEYDTVRFVIEGTLMDTLEEMKEDSKISKEFQDSRTVP